MSKKELTIDHIKTTKSSILSLVTTVVEALQELKGQEIVVLDLSEIAEASADFFIISSGTSSTHISGLGDRVEKNVKEYLGQFPSHVEGRKKQHWLLLDYFNVVVHIFDKEKRAFYDLESLWSDAKKTAYPDI